MPTVTRTPREGAELLTDATSTIEAAISDITDAIADATLALDTLRGGVTSTDEDHHAVTAALLVLLRTPTLRAYIQKQDPMAFRQARKALARVGEVIAD